MVVSVQDSMVYRYGTIHLMQFDIGRYSKPWLDIRGWLKEVERNKMHLDEVSGAYFDFGNHTEKVRLRWREVRSADTVKRELVRETLERPQLSLVPHVGYVSLFPFMMGIIPSTSWILEKQLELISNRSTLWTDYGLRSLSKTSSLYMKRNTEHDPPYWRGPIWINMNYMILSALHHYSQVDGPYKARAETLYQELRSNLIRNIVRNYYETGFLWEQYDQKNKGKDISIVTSSAFRKMQKEAKN
ncbi:hypothetical protein COCNU_15G004590 [Cocos nucifera]|uniref:Glycosyl hydrolase family 63 C-terminal domain-containing protein n=1 Tax=Cocos nucifera TaxID=13894 RepID=A0A8K0IX88_COCNU|nr:hypothetical protein COCNU_15G004590 [Cocos nucifera]